MRKKIGYARVSTTTPEQDSSIASQKARLANYGCDPIFAERESNKGIPRQLYEAAELCQKLGAGTQFVITNFDRISRDQDLAIFSLLGGLKRAGVVIWELDRNGPVDPEDLETRILGVLNAAERQKTGQKILRAYKRRRDEGLPIGKAPLGYKKDDLKTKMLPDPQYWDICRQAAEDYADGRLTLAGIQRIFVDSDAQVKSRSGASDWIKNPVLRGHLVYGTKNPEPLIIRNTHEPLIDADLHLKILYRLEFNQDMGPNKPLRDYAVFNGMVRCTHCKKACHTNCDKPTKKSPYRLRRFRCRTPGCKGKGGSIIDDVVEAQVQSLWSRLVAGEGIANGVGWHEIGFCHPCLLEAFSPLGRPIEPRPDVIKTKRLLKQAKALEKNDPKEGSRLVAKYEVQLHNQQALLKEWIKHEAETGKAATRVLAKEDWDSFPPLARRKIYKTAGVTVWVDKGKIVGINL